jgi:hypothetical protein
MAYTDLKISHAEKLAKELLVDGVIIIAFPIVGSPKYHKGVSYGATTAKCAELGKVLDRLCDLLDGAGKGNPQSPTTRRRQDGDEQT